MACYGIVKALLKKGVEVDLILPVHGLYYFPLRKEEDADTLPVADARGEKLIEEGREEIIKLLHMITPFYEFEERIISKIPREKIHDDSVESVLKILDNEGIIREVREYTRTASEIARRIPFDIVHAHDWLTYPAGIYIKFMCGKPLVSHIHATEFDRAGGPGNEIIHRIEYLGLKFADRVVAVSHYTEREIKEKYKVEGEKIRVVHNAFHIPEERGERIFRETTVVFVGRITLQKGPDYFVDLAGKVAEKVKDVKFIIAGSGDMERKVMEKASSFGLGTKILFTGFLSREEVSRLLSSADIFVMPSISEPFGIAALEAMSMGVVPIVSKNSGVAEVVENAFKVDFWDIDRMAEIIIHLISRKEYLRELSEKCKREARSIKWENQVEKLINVYMELRSS